VNINGVLEVRSIVKELVYEAYRYQNEVPCDKDIEKEIDETTGEIINALHSEEKARPDGVIS
jgi:hypothetical protein